MRRAMRDNRGFKDDVTTKGVDSTQRALVLRSSEASPPPAGGWALEISREVLDLVHQRGDGEDVLREGRPVREGLLDEVEEARVVEQELGEHLLEDVHPELEVGEGLDHVAVDRLDARLPLVVKLAREVLHRPLVHLGRVLGRRAGHEQGLGLLDEADHLAVVGEELLLHEDRLDLVEELLEVGRLLSPGAALGEGVDDEVVVVDEQRRLVLEGRVLPRESLGEELLDLGPQHAQDGAKHRLDRRNLEAAQRRDQLRVPAGDVVRRGLGRLAGRHEGGDGLDVRLHDSLEARPDEDLHSRKEVGEQRHRPRRHRVPLRRVDVDEEEAADGVPRGDEVLLEVLHRKEDGLAEDVVEGVRVAEEAGEEGVLRRGDVEQQRARGPEDGLVVEGLALLLRGGEDEGGLSGRVEDGAPLAQLEGAVAASVRGLGGEEGGGVADPLFSGEEVRLRGRLDLECQQAGEVVAHLGQVDGGHGGRVRLPHLCADVGGVALEEGVQPLVLEQHRVLQDLRVCHPPLQPPDSLEQKVAYALHRLEAELLELGRDVGAGGSHGGALELGEGDLGVELLHVAQVGRVHLGLADLRDQLRRHDDLRDEGRELCLGRLAVAQPDVHREALVLQVLDLRRDGRQVRLEAAQHRLHRVEHAVALADLGVQPGERLALLDVVGDRLPLHRAQRALHLLGVLPQVAAARQGLLHRRILRKAGEILVLLLQQRAQRVGRRRGGLAAHPTAVPRAAKPQMATRGLLALPR
mmetsp:Transcript_38370/g.120839  ORF Transcript_38370/g.120839 Transcript_38370/m.120839 type:complete len:749 (-) Transcript_38370:78-2324(-)